MWDKGQLAGMTSIFSSHITAHLISRQVWGNEGECWEALAAENKSQVTYRSRAISLR